jgi:hypothetical protein
MDFDITGPDGDNLVWLHLPKPDGGIELINLGKSEDVAEKFSEWLGSIDYQEHG